MASISVPCPKCYLIYPQTSWNRNLKQQQQQQQQLVSVSFLAGSTRISRLKVGPSQIHFPVLKAQAATEGSSNCSPLPSSKSETTSSDGKDPKVVKGSLSDSTISAFMAEVSDLVKLVDSRDIKELKLKHMDCELIIRKKEAFVQPPATAPVVMMQPPQQPMFSPQPQMAQPTPAATPPSAPAPTHPPPSKGTASSLPPLKCPMAGMFYRCPAPGEPPFVKVGDKVQKGQVICIIEAMKLMNEIEADQSGTIVEILAEDGKPVSIDTPLLTIQP